MSKTRSHVGRWRMWSCGQCITSARCHGYREFQLVLLCFIHLFSVNQRTLFFLPSLSLFSESHITGHPAGRVKLYLIKMLSSLPNSSPTYGSPYLYSVGGLWFPYSSISPSWTGSPYGSHFYMLFGMTRLRQHRWGMCLHWGQRTDPCVCLLFSYAHELPEPDSWSFCRMFVNTTVTSR